MQSPTQRRQHPQYLFHYYLILSLQVVENICANRVLVLVIKDVEVGITISEKIVDEQETRDLNLVRCFCWSLLVLV